MDSIVRAKTALRRPFKGSQGEKAERAKRDRELTRPPAGSQLVPDAFLFLNAFRSLFLRISSPATASGSLYKLQELKAGGTCSSAAVPQDENNERALGHVPTSRKPAARPAQRPGGRLRNRSKKMRHTNVEPSFPRRTDGAFRSCDFSTCTHSPRLVSITHAKEIAETALMN